MKRLIAIAATWTRRDVVIVVLAVIVAFGLITRPHVQRYCSSNPFNIGGDDYVFGTDKPCFVIYRFEWGY